MKGAGIKGYLLTQPVILSEAEGSPRRSAGFEATELD